jgi:hypothetical protein
VDQGATLTSLLWTRRAEGFPAWPAIQLGATLAAGCCLTLAAFAYSWRDRPAVILHVLGALICGGLFLAELALLGRAAVWPANPLVASILFVAAGCAGASVVALATLAMNVGHWFLVNPRLGIGNLSKPSKALFWALIARGVLLLAPAWATWQRADVEGMTLAGAILAYGFFEGARFVAGWLAPAILGWMALKTVEIRSTQAATGILYALLVLAAIGEGLGWFLTVSRLLPW